MAPLVRGFQLWAGKGISVAALALALGRAGPGFAQQQPQDQGQAAQPGDQQQGPPAQKAPEPYGGGTPLDVLMHTKLWEDVPEPKDFVKQSRPPDDALQYQPTQGDDPKGAQLLNPNQLDSLQDELEHAGAHAEHSAGVRIKHFTNIHTTNSLKGKTHKVQSAKVQSDKVHAEIPTNLHGQ
ncbi:MAG: hypothetical protein ABSC72_09960 [Methylovirgula sp.]|jgi:hypothetical protein